MSISVSLLIDDQTKDSDNCTISTVCLKNDLTVIDLQNMYKQSEDNEIYLIHRGEIPNTALSLTEIGIQEGSILKLVIKKVQKSHTSSYGDSAIKEIVKKHQHMMKTRFKQVVSESLEHGLDSVMMDHQEVEQCLLAYSIASDHRLLRTLLGSTENVTKLLQECPVLIGPATKMINLIQERLRRCASQPPPGHEARYFSLGEVEQSEDSEESEGESEPVPTGQVGSISRGQLREAISHVGAPRVSLSQLRSAIEGASGGGGGPGEPMEVDGGGGFDDSLDQLAAMGFTDRQAGRAALEAVGGDLEAAIELLLS